MLVDDLVHKGNSDRSLGECKDTKQDKDNVFGDVYDILQNGHDLRQLFHLKIIVKQIHDVIDKSDHIRQKADNYM